MEDIYEVKGTTENHEDGALNGTEETKTEVKIIRAKKPILKLTPERLTENEDGFSSLYNDIKYNLIIKGEGHEITDLQRLMNIYRGWHNKVMPKYKFDHFVKQLRVQGKEPQVLNSLEQYRKLHKGIITTLEEEKTDFKKEDDFAPSIPEEDEYQAPPQEDEDDLQEFLEAAQEQKQQKVEPELKKEKVIVNEKEKENIKPADDDDSLNDDDLDDIISDEE
ncbi:unnamed protein product [Moneuplotes crassus]|uniref:Chromosome segregation in meiosis protein 3 domain-containing protein n=1 Tax=Euplotes crassus TaxID=5936 RepID=A0AAD1XY55_EUPCR|nr:unnamed protein product [Moneuplotes crassus]